jgi:hypothetical protein
MSLSQTSLDLMSLRRRLQGLLLAGGAVSIVLDALFEFLPFFLGRSATIPVADVTEFTVEVVLMVAFVAVLFLVGRSLFARLRYFEGLYHLCANCNRVQTGEEWVQLEAYIRDHSSADFSHGLCPDCAEAFNRELEF